MPDKNADAIGGGTMTLLFSQYRCPFEGQVSLGEAQATLALDCKQTYYVTVKAVTGDDVVLSSHSNGVTIDCDRPSKKFKT